MNGWKNGRDHNERKEKDQIDDPLKGGERASGTPRLSRGKETNPDHGSTSTEDFILRANLI